MKINLNQDVVDFDGKVINIKFEEDGPLVPQTLRSICFTAVTSVTPQDRSKTPDTAMKLYGLAQKLFNDGKDDGLVELSAEEIVLIKDRINSTYPSVIIIGSSYALLEGSN